MDEAKGDAPLLEGEVDRLFAVPLEQGGEMPDLPVEGGDSTRAPPPDGASTEEYITMGSPPLKEGDIMPAHLVEEGSEIAAPLDLVEGEEVFDAGLKEGHTITPLLHPRRDGTSAPHSAPLEVGDKVYALPIEEDACFAGSRGRG
jgi:hypothetical protein